MLRQVVAAAHWLATVAILWVNIPESGFSAKAEIRPPFVVEHIFVDDEPIHLHRPIGILANVIENICSGSYCREPHWDRVVRYWNVDGCLNRGQFDFQPLSVFLFYKQESDLVASDKSWGVSPIFQINQCAIKFTIPFFLDLNRNIFDIEPSSYLGLGIQLNPSLGRLGIPLRTSSKVVGFLHLDCGAASVFNGPQCCVQSALNKPNANCRDENCCNRGNEHEQGVKGHVLLSLQVSICALLLVTCSPEIMPLVS